MSLLAARKGEFYEQQETLSIRISTMRYFHKLPSKAKQSNDVPTERVCKFVILPTSLGIDAMLLWPDKIETMSVDERGQRMCQK